MKAAHRRRHLRFIGHRYCTQDWYPRSTNLDTAITFARLCIRLLEVCDSELGTPAETLVDDCTNAFSAE